MFVGGTTSNERISLQLALIWRAIEQDVLKSNEEPKMLKKGSSNDTMTQPRVYE